MTNFIAIAVGLLYFYGIMEGHPIDFGLPLPSKEQLIEDYEREREIEKASSTLLDPNSTQEEKDQALDQLDKVGVLA